VVTHSVVAWRNLQIDQQALVDRAELETINDESMPSPTFCAVQAVSRVQPRSVSLPLSGQIGAWVMESRGEPGAMREQRLIHHHAQAGFRPPPRSLHIGTIGILNIMDGYLLYLF
jgi:hypothetical protein